MDKTFSWFSWFLMIFCCYFFSSLFLRFSLLLLWLWGPALWSEMPEYRISEFIKTTVFAPSRQRNREIRSSEEELEIEIPRVTSMLHLFHWMTFAPSVISVIKSFSKFLASLSSVWNWDQELWDGGQAVEERHDYIMC